MPSDVLDDGEVGCIHFPDDPNAKCSICIHLVKGDDPWSTTEVSQSVSPGIIEAMFRGECRCGASIYPGDLIRRVNEQWQHIDCSAHG